MPTIRISDEVFAHLKRHAEPLVDSANDVLERVFANCPVCSEPGTQGSDSTSAEVESAPISTVKRRSLRGRRLPAGELLAHQAYELPILVALDEVGGSAPVSEIIERVGRMLDDKFGEADRSLNNSGGVRWVNRTQWMRQRLVEGGYLAKESPRGIWTITDAGRTRMRELAKKVG